MNNPKLSPCLKWVGGKRQLVDRILERCPSKFERYYEPFIGGGTILFNLMPEQAVISDVNEQLICMYKHLKEDVHTVISEIRNIEAVPCDKDYYYWMRDKFNKKISNQELDAECAALMIWINKHCYNGLYRVNSKGLYNVPYCNNATVKTIKEENLINIGTFLKTRNIDIRVQDFEEACVEAKAGDFVYFDSPYIPESQTACFTSYTNTGFSREDHERLAKLFTDLDRRGVQLMLSNNNVPQIYELYAGFSIETVNVRRNINCDANKRTGQEVIITNYNINKK